VTLASVIGSAIASTRAWEIGEGASMRSS
jgi:hypothetical protein